MNTQKREAYTGLRSDVISMITAKPIKVLDVGCSNGALLEYAKSQLGASFTAGIELDEQFAQEAARKADSVVRADLDDFRVEALGGGEFDLIILADVLEHTREPARVLSEVLKAGTFDAEIIVSLPNIQHWTAIKNLLVGKWPRRDRGLFDKTHLRFFTWRSIVDLATECGLKIESRRRNLRIMDSPGARINRLSWAFGVWPLASFFTYQYVVRLRRI